MKIYQSWNDSIKIDGSDDRQQANDVLTWLFSIIAPRNKYKEHQNMNTL